jgi:hypothetical protein
MSQECKTCKEVLSIDKFRKGLKSCKKCNYNKTKCSHGTEKKKCKECKGSGICEHNKQKQSCNQCRSPSSLCEHNKQKQSCGECNLTLNCGICRSVQISKSTNFYPLCEACYCNEYPDSPLSVNYKVKERYLFDEVKKRFSDVNMRINKKIDGGCSRRKPDILIDKNIFSIIIECDENQHENYECENKRNMELFQDLGSRPLVIIRFNPDSFKTNGVTYSGCFQSVSHLYQKKFYNLNEYEWIKRIDILEDVIKKYMNMQDIPDKEITIEKLFYDGYTYVNRNILGTNKIKKYLNNSYIINSYISDDMTVNICLVKDGNTQYICIIKGEVLCISKAEFESKII